MAPSSPESFSGEGAATYRTIRTLSGQKQIGNGPREPSRFIQAHFSIRLRTKHPQSRLHQAAPCKFSYECGSYTAVPQRELVARTIDTASRLRGKKTRAQVDVLTERKPNGCSDCYVSEIRNCFTYSLRMRLLLRPDASHLQARRSGAQRAEAHPRDRVVRSVRPQEAIDLVFTIRHFQLSRR